MTQNSFLAAICVTLYSALHCYAITVKHLATFQSPIPGVYNFNAGAVISNNEIFIPGSVHNHTDIYFVLYIFDLHNNATPHKILRFDHPVADVRAYGNDIAVITSSRYPNKELFLHNKNHGGADNWGLMKKFDNIAAPLLASLYNGTVIFTANDKQGHRRTQVAQKTASDWKSVQVLDTPESLGYYELKGDTIFANVGGDKPALIYKKKGLWYQLVQQVPVKAHDGYTFGQVSLSKGLTGALISMYGNSLPEPKEIASVFTADAKGRWSETARLSQPGQVVKELCFVTKDIAVVGATIPFHVGNGKVYLYQRSDQDMKLVSEIEGGICFGCSVSCNDETSLAVIREGNTFYKIYSIQ
jgi:(2Fe-2S) ferredoxin